MSAIAIEPTASFRELDEKHYLENDSPKFITPPLTLADFENLRRAHKAKAKMRKLTAADMVVYALLRNQPLRVSFKPIQSQIKLANGQAPYSGLGKAIVGISGVLMTAELAKQFTLEATRQYLELSSL
jgi:hypothetical protein